MFKFGVGGAAGAPDIKLLFAFRYVTLMFV
jgi:hypothetical protein